MMSKDRVLGKPCHVWRRGSWGQWLKTLRSGKGPGSDRPAVTERSDQGGQWVLGPLLRGRTLITMVLLPPGRGGRNRKWNIGQDDGNIGDQ